MTIQSIDGATNRTSFRTEPATVLRMMGENLTPVLDAAMGAAAFETFDASGAEGSGPPPHSHPWDEGYVVIDGQLAVIDWSAGMDQPAEQLLGPGGSAFVPGGTTHSFQVRSDRCRYFVVTTPGAHAMFADAEETLAGATDDLATLVAVATRNGCASPLF